MKTPKVIVPLADGVEEMEAVIIVDTLRRAKLDVISAAIGKTKIINASRGVVLIADSMWNEIKPTDFDAIILPGGAVGCDNLIKCTALLEALQMFDKQSKLIGAICAGPLVLQSAGILSDIKVTCHPAVANKLTVAKRTSERVVHAENIITSQGPGSSFEFALAIIKEMCGSEIADVVAAGLIMPGK